MGAFEVKLLSFEVKFTGDSKVNLHFFERHIIFVSSSSLLCDKKNHSTLSLHGIRGLPDDQGIQESKAEHTLSAFMGRGPL